MEIARGKAFHFDLKSDPAHLWVIASDPDSEGSCLIVSLTSFKGNKDRTVILNAGEHPFIKWPTCVAYAFSEIIPVERVETWLACGNAKFHASPLTEEKMKLILEGFLASDFTKKRIVSYVRALKATP